MFLRGSAVRRLISITAIALWAGGPAWAVDDGPLPEPAPSAPGAAQLARSPEAIYNEALELAERQEWDAAEAGYREAIRVRPAFPEAWNGLGYVLRQQGRYDDSIPAYLHALELRADYAEALEYLGEAYAELGRIDEARAVLRELHRLGAPHAARLEMLIPPAARD